MINEKLYTTVLGDDVSVTVAYEIDPYEPATRDYPVCDAQVTINAVMIDGLESKDIIECLNDVCITELEVLALAHEYENIDDRECDD